MCKLFITIYGYSLDLYDIYRERWLEHSHTAMPPRQHKQKYPWPYVKAPPLNPNPLVGPPSSSPDRRRRRRRVPEPSEEPDIDGEALVGVEPEPQQQEEAPAQPVADVLVASDSSEDKGTVDRVAAAKQKRARVHTFGLYFNELTAEIQQQWIETTKPGYPNKRAKRREILDFVVTRTSTRQINPSARTINKNLFCRQHEAQEERNLGMTRTELRAKLGDQLFQQGLDCGDIVENTKDNLFYMRTAEQRKEKAATVEHNAILEYSLPDNEDFLGTAAGFIEEHMMLDDNGARSSGDPSPPQVGQDIVSDELLKKVQQCYDAGTRLRSNVSQCGQELMRVAGLTPDGVQMVQKASR